MHKQLTEFNYELRLANARKQQQEQDMWNLCWTDSIIGVDFCREMRRFQKINVSACTFLLTTLFSNYKKISAFSWNV
jgi:hypothetical protein